MTYFVIAIIFFILGRYAFNGHSNVVHRNIGDMPGHRTAPPPPPRPIVPTMPGHLRPEYSGHKRGMYNNVNKCDSCGLIGLYNDMHIVDPCGLCGGKVIRSGAARWEIVDGMWQWVFAKKND